MAGIGFTVSLLIADITFEGVELEEAKLGILAASIVASLLGWLVFTVVHRLPPAKANRGADGLAPPILDLTEDIDPEVDHIRGPLNAPVTLVEYGDFECPYCGQAEPAVRELVQHVRQRPAVRVPPPAPRRTCTSTRRWPPRPRRPPARRDGSGRCTTG